MHFSIANLSPFISRLINNLQDSNQQLILRRGSLVGSIFTVSRAQKIMAFYKNVVDFGVIVPTIKYMKVIHVSKSKRSYVSAKSTIHSPLPNPLFT